MFILGPIVCSVRSSDDGCVMINRSDAMVASQRPDRGRKGKHTSSVRDILFEAFQQVEEEI